jgi:hypothetical protein
MPPTPAADPFQQRCEGVCAAADHAGDDEPRVGEPPTPERR